MIFDGKECKKCNGVIHQGFYDQDYCRSCQANAFSELPKEVQEHITNMIYDAKEDVLETIELREQYG